MKLPVLLATLAAALTLAACEKTTVNNPPVVETPTPAAVPVPVPGPAGPAGAPGTPGAPGEPGKPGDTLIVVPDAKPADAPPPPAR
ncbi:hypothetical protein LJR289_003017 [Pseudoduganella sp. LjRoot289]|uniref:hypothetical protein n=1 Tax=Pseudoduganella sp. LjRoot289 TaxID=3342314 RepID=UPI003ED058D8